MTNEQIFDDRFAYFTDEPAIYNTAMMADQMAHDRWLGIKYLELDSWAKQVTE